MMNENYSPIQDISQNKLIIKDNNCTQNIPKLDELNSTTKNVIKNSTL